MKVYDSNVSDSIGSRLAASLQGKNSFRPDLHVADFQHMTEKAVRALIGYSAALGKPDASEVDAFVIKHFEGKIVADLRNAKNIESCNVVECILKIPSHTRPYSDSKNMRTIVAGTRFLDADLGTVWDTEASGDDQCLVRVTKEPIKDILMARRNAMISKANLTTFADVEGERGELQIDKNDYAMAHYNGDQRKCVVASVGNDLVKVVFSDGSMASITKASVIRIEAKNDAGDAKHIKFLRDFYSQFTSQKIVDELYPPSKA